MIIRSLYLGASSVLRIYQDNKIIWNALEPFALISRVEISTYGNATLCVPILFGLEGDGESVVDAIGVGRASNISNLIGVSPNNTYGISLITLFNMIRLDGRALSTSDSDVLARLFDLVSTTATVEETTETSCIITLFNLIPTASEVEVESYTEAVAHTPKLLKIDEVKVPINNYTSAICYSWWLKSVLGQNESETEALAEAHTPVSSPVDAEGIYLITYANAIANSIPFFDISGFNVANTFGNAETITFPSKSIDAIAEIISEALCNGNPLPAISGDGKGEITNEGKGMLMFLYLPVLENNVLKIPSAYGASVLDGVLEVI